MKGNNSIRLSDRRFFILIQINNGFKDYYYVDESKDYRVYNSKFNKYLTLDSGGSYTLIKLDGKTCHISRNKLLKLLFGKTFVLQDVENLPGERWAQLNESTYFISTKGRCKNNKLLESKILIPETSSGYERVNIDIGYGVRHYLIHKLVATMFLPPPKEPFMDIHHINNDKLSNFVENLMFIKRDEHIKLHSELRKKEQIDEQEKNSN